MTAPRRTRTTSIAALAGLTLLAAAALALLGGRAGDLAASVVAAPRIVPVEVWIEVVVLGVGVAAALWMLTGAVVALLCALLVRGRRAGERVDAALGRWAPVVVRRLARSAVGVGMGAGLALAPVAATATEAPPVDGPAVVLDLGWRATAADGTTSGGAELDGAAATTDGAAAEPRTGAGAASPAPSATPPTDTTGTSATTSGPPAPSAVGTAVRTDDVREPAEPAEPTADGSSVPAPQRAEPPGGSSSGTTADTADRRPGAASGPAGDSTAGAGTAAHAAGTADQDARDSAPAGTREPARTGDTHHDGPPAGEVVVVRGDTLWDIAARHLPEDATDGDVLRAMLRWHDANRAVVGDDPDVVLPGQVLRAP
ncbi:LysM peptidoglycan-binding domain-containing protein [Isoptericola dokdonensis]|uniref:LysM domain-containing protein n=1 Tax=Isoptericola dokdonensis DS-3 TaxID=1300344 RepID=A0A168G190_9MICO|nr:LysM domain-containing protein [Isoptericola dokdonensis]ANC32889.1 hypothetical protein I598_3380 [Isoptericola dokdonensis DS-3]